LLSKDARPCHRALWNNPELSDSLSGDRLSMLSVKRERLWKWTRQFM